MKNNNMKEQLANFYEKQSLDSDRLAALKANIAQTAEQADEDHPDKPDVSTATSHKIWHHWPRLLSAAAAILIVAILGVQIYLNQTATPDDTKRALQSIAMNHQDYLGTENPIQASIAELREAMPKLNFQPIDPEKLKDLGFTPKGARYCSINNQRAVLIQMEDKQGLTWTLYQCLDTNKLKAVKSCNDKQDGTYVSIWRESGLVLAIAGPKPLSTFTD